MLPNGSIEAERLWKRFRADRRGALLRGEVRRLAVRLRGGDTSKYWRWALRDINMSLSPGESVGLVGPNGSGKTTLLKILSRVMHPYAGRLQIAGRVGALIEIRSGIHPELTGRENVYLFGSLLGLPRKAIARRFDDIISFSQLENAVDRQTKFYSSGMQMRLGFSIAAFLEPDILLVDEVLAVGDAEFQQRCLERMRHVIAQGTTVVYVSHDLSTVEATCTRGVWLSNGVVQAEGLVRDVLDQYRRSVEETIHVPAAPSGALQVVSADVTSVDGGLARTQGDVGIRVRLRTPSGNKDPRVSMFLGVTEGPAVPIFVVRREIELSDDEIEVNCVVRHLPLPKGRYYLWLGLQRYDDGNWARGYGVRTQRQGGVLLPWQSVRSFEVVGEDLDLAPPAIVRPVPIHVDASWDVARGNGGTSRGVQRGDAAGGAREGPPAIVT